MAETGTFHKFIVRVPDVEVTPQGQRVVKGEIFIEPFKGRKDFPIYKWCRDTDVVEVQVRFVEAAYIGKKEKEEVWGLDGSKIDEYDLALFTDLTNGRQYDVAHEIVPKGIQVGDRVKLTILGCCSIVGVDDGKQQEQRKRREKKANSGSTGSSKAVSKRARKTGGRKA